jgi:hypothetical protein
MTGQGDFPRSEAERVWSAHQRFAAVERSRERAKEAWRNDMLLRQQIGPLIGFALAMGMLIGWLVSGRMELLIGLGVGIALSVGVVAAVRRSSAVK